MTEKRNLGRKFLWPTILVGALLAGCAQDVRHTNPDQEAYGTTATAPAGYAPDVEAVKRRVPIQYREKPIWTF